MQTKTDKQIKKLKIILMATSQICRRFVCRRRFGIQFGGGLSAFNVFLDDFVKVFGEIFPLKIFVSGVLTSNLSVGCRCVIIVRPTRRRRI